MPPEPITYAPPLRMPAGTLMARMGLYGHGNRVLVLALLLLHGALVWGFGQPWGQALLLAHYGIFLLWQPFIFTGNSLSPSRALGVLGVGVALALMHYIWLGALWSILLIGLVGGIAVSLKSMRERLGLWLAVLYLLLLLFIWILPRGFGLPVRGSADIEWLRDGLLALPLAILLFPSPKLANRTAVVDLLYTLLFVLVIGVLALGSFAAMQLSETDYAKGLLISIGSLTFTLIAITWLWQPRAGESGLRNLFSRYVLSLGLPLEEWLKQLSEAAERETDPELFLHMAMAGFTHLPWSTGVIWRTRHSTGALGDESLHHVAFSHLGVDATFYTDSPVNPAFGLHLRLLTEIIGYFYAAKLRERELQANAYTQAVYETGSRLTHDVKNLLQSLKTLCSAAEHSQPEQAASLQNLMQRQLPQITKRLEITLDKLKSPERAADKNQILAREWWRNLKNRYAHDDLSFSIDDEAAATWLPQELFDSVADNLVQNALRKRTGHTELTIGINLVTAPIPVLSVCDTGEAMPSVVVERLFHSPVSTYDGLGIGLYQAAKQALGLGYRLELANNRDGEVCISLWQESV